jgi:uncharacterized repeat protein (TIGR04076 family)
MAEKFDIKVRVISQKGFCGLHHKVGDEWTIGEATPGGICASAYAAMYPNARTLKFGGVFPWEKDPDSCIVACPDAENPVVFELRRIRK